MARKRSFADKESGNTMVLDSGSTLDQHQHQHQHQRQQQQRSQQKRCCGTAQNPAPGELKSDEVATYLHNLSAHMTTSQLEHASTVLSTEGWQAFAELNILLSSCLSSGALPDQLLRSYSRFTLQPRPELWDRYSTYAAAKGNLSAQELQLLRFLLEWVLAPHPDCALTEVTLELPPWMVSWCSRWGMANSSNRIRLICLEAYAPVDPCCSTSMSTGRQPARVLYLPASA